VTTDNKVISEAGTDVFSSAVTGLKGSTTYYARAYAINSAGTAYGNEISFMTAPPTAPALSTTLVSALTTNSALSGGTVSSDGGADVTIRGVCWSLSHDPTTADSKTLDGEGTGTFTTLLDLMPIQIITSGLMQQIVLVRLMVMSSILKHIQA
jgi:hypothetical protein